MRSTDDKQRTVLTRNTYFQTDAEADERYETHLTALVDTLLNLKNEIAAAGSVRREVIFRLLEENEHGLRALLALTGIRESPTCSSRGLHSLS
ncbi:MAG TPA: hypothetical protein PLD47_13665 [Aggregatilineales bacterium]|nr:hypothetical protein [Anaerolineales bacterium]HRE48768.1 hypothetical protein [Aggregatilineales bacterium]